MFPIYFLRFRSVFSVRNYAQKSSFSTVPFESKVQDYKLNITGKKESFSCDIISWRSMAGHSKWQNIKHIKAAKDSQKTFLCNKYVRLITFAAREGGPDPKLNKKLSDILDEARKNNVPKDTLENALKRSRNKKTKFGTIEILGPGGCMVIIEYETDSVPNTRHEIKFICKKYNAIILSGEGRWRAIFERKGIITSVKEVDGKELDEGKALDSAIEAGAEEVQMKENEEEKKFLEFICIPDDLHAVKKELEKRYEIEEHYVAYLPISNVQLSDEDMVTVDSFLEDLENNPDIVRIYENVQ